MTDPLLVTRLRALIEQLDYIGVEIADDGAWYQNNEPTRSVSKSLGGRMLIYANEIKRIQSELEAALTPAVPPSVATPEEP